MYACPVSWVSDGLWEELELNAMRDSMTRCEDLVVNLVSAGVSGAHSLASFEKFMTPLMVGLFFTFFYAVHNRLAGHDRF